MYFCWLTCFFLFHSSLPGMCFDMCDIKINTLRNLICYSQCVVKITQRFTYHAFCITCCLLISLVKTHLPHLQFFFLSIYPSEACPVVQDECKQSTAMLSGINCLHVFCKSSGSINHDMNWNVCLRQKKRLGTAFNLCGGKKSRSHNQTNENGVDLSSQSPPISNLSQWDASICQPVV